jgi:hypothetical protein
LFQLITIFNLIAFRKKSNTFTSINISQKNTIVEIVRLLDKHIEVCFPQMNRDCFVEAFSKILYFHDLKNKSIVVIEDRDPLMTREGLINSRFNSQIESKALKSNSFKDDTKN